MESGYSALNCTHDSSLALIVQYRPDTTRPYRQREPVTRREDETAIQSSIRVRTDLHCTYWP